MPDQHNLRESQPSQLPRHARMLFNFDFELPLQRTWQNTRTPVHTYPLTLTILDDIQHGSNQERGENEWDFQYRIQIHQWYFEDSPRKAAYHNRPYEMAVTGRTGKTDVALPAYRRGSQSMATKYC